MAGNPKGSFMGACSGRLYPVHYRESEYGGDRDGDYLHYGICSSSEDKTIRGDRGGVSSSSAGGSEGLRDGA